MLDRRHRGSADVAVLFRKQFRILGHETQQGPEILEIEQQKTLFVSNPERNIQNAFLGVIEFQQV
jgi:hypothetical protein